ncbi:hypothetical protein JCM19239_6994 [Vibrio variabilis]|uniref:Uncharacterized protein n=1 Tax=Vibrio variabilis TaxID=990271 RepID=A0ABQ0JQ82_9VIBR|nr:hypothetical protein JCM19239_6994 [Vibrio variabilis]
MGIFSGFVRTYSEVVACAVNLYDKICYGRKIVPAMTRID